MVHTPSGVGVNIWEIRITVPAQWLKSHEEHWILAPVKISHYQASPGDFQWLLWAIAQFSHLHLVILKDCPRFCFPGLLVNVNKRKGLPHIFSLEFKALHRSVPNSPFCLVSHIISFKFWTHLLDWNNSPSLDRRSLALVSSYLSFWNVLPPMFPVLRRSVFQQRPCSPTAWSSPSTSWLSITFL